MRVAWVLLLATATASAGGAGDRAEDGPLTGRRRRRRGGVSDEDSWIGRFRRAFQKVRRRLLSPAVAGAEPWSDADLASAPQRLSRLIDGRCGTFRSAARWRHRHLVFTHVPKTGGQSMHGVLYKNAKRGGVDVAADLLTGHIRYGDVVEWKPRFVTAPTEADFFTVLREPNSLVLSDFSYMRRNPKHPGHHGAKRFTSLRHYLQNELDDGTGMAFALFSQHSRKNRTLEMLRAHCTRARHRAEKEPEAAELCAEGWRIFLRRAAALLASRYAVVGILERLPETVEVARCRVPWLRNMSSIPKYNVRPRGEQDDDDAGLLRAKTAQAQLLYEAANRMLDADLKCCRSGAATALE